MNTPATILGAVHGRDSWSSFRTAFPSSRKPIPDLLDPDPISHDDRWSSRPPPAWPSRAAHTAVAAAGGNGGALLSESPLSGGGLAAAEQLDGALMRAYFRRAMAHLQALCFCCRFCRCIFKSYATACGHHPLLYIRM